MEIFGNGQFFVDTPCQRLVTTTIAPGGGLVSGCNGMDGDEPPLSVAADGVGSYWLSAGDIPPGSLYGIRYFSGAEGVGRNPADVGA